MVYANKPIVRQIDLSLYDGPSSATVIAVPLPANTVGIVSGVRTAGWVQRFNAYLVDDNGFVQDPQTVWLASSDESRFNISAVQPASAAEPDPHVFSYGPYQQRYDIAIYASHQKPDETTFETSDPKFSTHDFTIGNKTAITFTMVNAEDGGDSDYHDTVVGVSVSALTK